VITPYAARKRAEQRLLAIGLAALPKGWGYKFRDTWDGDCWPLLQYIEASRPTTRRRLHIWLHECGHAHDHRRCPLYLAELRAELWAISYMREHGVPVPRVSVKRAQRNVGFHIKLAIARGAKDIDAEAQAFAQGATTHRKRNAAKRSTP